MRGFLVLRLKSKVVGIMIFFLLVIAGVFFLADASKVRAILAQFDWSLLPLVLTLTLTDDLLRFMKWHYLLKRLNVKLLLRDSAGVFFSGLAMAITPGKIGETVKAYFVKQRTGVAISRTLPVVVVERLTDLIAVTLLAAIGAIYFHYGIIATVVILLLIFAFVGVIQSKRVSVWLINKLASLPLMRRYKQSIHQFYEGSYQLLKLHYLAFAISISIIAWSAECTGLYVIYYGLGRPQSFLLSSFVFSFSSVAGAISTLPGGLGVAEASMTGVMVAAGIERSIAACAMILIRFCTLWFGFLVGFIVLMMNRRKFELSQLGGDRCRE